MSAAVQVLAIVLAAPLLHGLMRSLRARLQGRPGPSILQPYRDLRKLLGKECVLPEGTSPLAAAAPGVALGVALVVAAALPLRPHAGNAYLDIVARGFVLALGRFALVLAALDSRSAFAGMGASRDVTFGALVEPTLLVALLGAATLGGGTALAAIAGGPFHVASMLAFAAFVLVTLVETARIPVDNQETHYELTMIHEGLLLEFGGPHLAALQLAAYVKQASFLLLAALMLPAGGLAATLGWMLAIALGVTLVETLFAKLRLFEVPQLLATSFILAATSIVLRALGGNA